MSAAALVWLQRLLPQRLLGRLIYRIGRTERRWIKTPLIAWFARHYDVDLAEAHDSELASYPSFNAFFTRQLRPGARPIDAAPDAIVSPVDGELTELGHVAAGRLLQAKGFDYGLAELLGEAAEPFAGGAFATVYLCPRDYHRVHTPFAATLRRMRYIAGKRFMVNTATVGRIRNLFCRNERLVCWFDSSIGPYVLVLVGALNVASISTAALGEIPSGTDRTWPALAPLRYERGETFAAFNLGSTIVMIFPPGTVAWRSDLHRGQRLLFGTRIGTAPAAARP